MCARVRRKPVQRRSSETDVVMNIDETGGDIELRDIYNLCSLVFRNVLFDGSDFALEDGNIPYLVNVISRVNHMPALQQQVITRRGRLPKCHDWNSEDDCEYGKH